MRQKRTIGRVNRTCGKCGSHMAADITVDGWPWYTDVFRDAKPPMNRTAEWEDPGAPGFEMEVTTESCADCDREAPVPVDVKLTRLP